MLKNIIRVCMPIPLLVSKRAYCFQTHTRPSPLHIHVQMAEETLGGEDARVEHDARGTRWDFPPRRRRFFGGLDTETVKFVHGVLRKARGGHEENTRQEGLIAACDAAVVMEGAAGRDEAVHRTVVNSADEISRSRDAGGKALLLVGFDDHSTGVLTRDYAETPEAAGEKASPTSTAQRTRRAKETDLLLHQFAGRAETRRRSATLSHTFGRWSSLTAQMREVRGKINFRFDQRQRVRALAMQRRVFAALGRHSARNRLTREAARQMLNGRRAVTARQVLEAFASNLERGRALGFSADALRVRVSVSADRRALSNAITALKRKRNRSRDLTRRAEKMRIDVLTRRPSIGAFRAWATAAGLVGRLRNRLGRAERALLENVLAAWTLFVRHSAAKRARRQKRTDQRAKRARVRAWDAEVLDVAFFDWANATAATKFRRLRLLAHAFHGWRAAASQGVSRG